MAVLSSSISASVKQSLLEAFAADLTITSLNFNTGVSSEFIDDISQLDDLAAVSPVRVSQVRITTADESQEEVTTIAAIDPATVEQVWATGAEPGIEAVVEGMIVETNQMEDRGWAVGDTLTLEFPTGESTDLEVTGTLASEAFGGILISEERFVKHYPDTAPTLVLVAVGEGIVLEEAQQRVQDLAADYPLVQIQTKSEFAADFENQIDQLVAVFNGLLALAIVIAILGITNTLALSITERIREIGLLRAVGMVRRQVRRMVRWEAVIVAVFGAVLGVLLGVVLGWAVRLALADDGLEVFSPSHNPTAHLRGSGRCSRSASRHPPRPVGQPHQNLGRHRLRIGSLKHTSSGGYALARSRHGLAPLRFSVSRASPVFAYWRPIVHKMEQILLRQPLPQLDLALTPTPLHEFPRLREAWGGPHIWVKRDDLTGFGLSGNKVRKLEFHLAAAREAGADTVITCGTFQSNHCRATALACARLGFDARLVLRTPDGKKPTTTVANLIIDMLAGATIRYISQEEWKDRDTIMADEAAKLAAEGPHGVCDSPGGVRQAGDVGDVAGLSGVGRADSPRDRCRGR